MFIHLNNVMSHLMKQTHNSTYLEELRKVEK